MRSPIYFPNLHSLLATIYQKSDHLISNQQSPVTTLYDIWDNAISTSSFGLLLKYYVTVTTNEGDVDSEDRPEASADLISDKFVD